MLNILVSGASGIVGYGILSSLRIGVSNIRLIGTTIYDDSPALLFCDIFEKSISTNHPDYIDWLLKIIKKHSIDVLIPGIDCDMIEWNKHRKILEESGAFLLLNNQSLIELCWDKWKFYQKLKKIYPELAIPTFLYPDQSLKNNPIILKPRIGYGSKGIIRLSSKDKIKEYEDQLGKVLMIQPIIGDDNFEYTVSAFFNKNSTLIDYLPLRRKLSSSGYTNFAEVVDINFTDILNKLAYHLCPIGPTNFQFRYDGSKFMLLEINPRISSSTSIRSKLGFNESKMSIEYFLKGIVPNKVDRNQILNKRIIRYIEEIILD